LILLFAGSVAIGMLFESSVILLIMVILVAGSIHLFFGWLKEKKLSHLYVNPEEPSPDEHDPEAEVVPQSPPAKLKGPLKYIILVLQLGAGGLFGYSIVSLIFRFIDGHDGGLGIYIGLLGLSVVVFVAALIIQLSKDSEVKKELSTVKDEMKFYETDERVNSISHKAGYIALWAVLATLLLFGGAVVALPIENINILTVGILGICALGVVIYVSFVAHYSEAKNFSITSANPRLKIIFFALSLVPLILMGLQWIFNGLSSAGIAFFAAYVIASGVLLLEAIAQARIADVKKR